MKGHLLLVIPPVLADTADGVMIDEHFGNNLAAYLRAFDRVTVACPAIRGSLANCIPLDRIADYDRCSVVVLPEPYREDRFFLRYAAIKGLLGRLIDEADYLLISPHAAFDWSTLATRIALQKGRDYNMEGDWNLQDVVRSQLRAMPWGLNRIRKWLWYRVHDRYYLDSMRKSRLALLQGRAVFDAYKNVAPNPRQVLNVQVTAEDRIPPVELAAKLAKVRSGAPLNILYAGRAIQMKGPDDWQRALQHAFAAGLDAQAVWLGEGELLPHMRRTAVERGVAEKIAYPGNVDRTVAFKMLRDADLFLFCHLTDESPRCLVEALTAGSPIVGYASLYACDLVEERGGGEFVALGDWRGLGDRVAELDRDRDRLAKLIEAAHSSAKLYDRETAIQNRIELIREYLRPPERGTKATIQ